MKTMNKKILSPVDKKVLKELVHETKETVAIVQSDKKGSAPIFSFVDLWRLQKKQKTLGSSTKW